MVSTIPKYLRNRFIGIFGFCLFAVILVFVIVDVVQEMDKFLDQEVPSKIVFLYYIYYIPYILVLCVPATTLMATVFSVGSFARHNEMVALKSLGYSLYRVLWTLMGMGLLVSVFTFVLAEVVAVQATKKRVEIERHYLEKGKGRRSSRLRNLEIQAPPDKLVTIGQYDAENKKASRVKIEMFDGARLHRRIDAPSMVWDEDAWIIQGGYERTFDGNQEHAVPIDTATRYQFNFGPTELLHAQVKPDEMGFIELVAFVKRIKTLGGEVHRWLTDLHLRISFPLSSLGIVLFSVPIAYNIRKRSLAVGFGICLAVCFFYFGMVKMGETMGQKGSLHPVWAAWLGNQAMIIGGVINLIKTRK